MKTALLSLMLLTGCSAASRYTRPGGLQVVTLTFDSSNAHLVIDGDKALLVDSGYEVNAGRLEDELRAAGIDPATQLKAIVVTHGHADHAGGARHFQQKFKVPVFIGAADEAMFSTGRNEPLCPVGVIASLRHRDDERATYTGATADVLVQGVLNLEASTGIDAKVVPVPGHTRGSVLVAVGDVVLAGDLLRGGIVGAGAETHFFMCDLEENRRVIARVVRELKPAVFFVGHFGPVTTERVQEHFDLH